MGHPVMIFLDVMIGMRKQTLTSRKYLKELIDNVLGMDIKGGPSASG